MSGIVEKPGHAQAPSDYASVGTYLLTPDVFGYLDKGLRTLTKGQEFQVTSEVFEPMLRNGKQMYGYIVQNAKRYDTGTQLEYLKTLFAFAIQHDTLGPELRTFLGSQLTTDELG
jgi:UTP--glucose-1-phosphate uridylyltransferase